MKGFLKSVFAPLAIGVVAANVVGMGLETLRQGQLVLDFRDVSSTPEGIAVISGMAVAGLTGYLFGKQSSSTPSPQKL